MALTSGRVGESTHYLLFALALHHVACYIFAREGGGELEPHLPSGPQRVENHRLGSSERHPLTVKPGSRLESLLGVGAKSVNSLHHQAVRAVGDAHLAVGHSPDGVIEAGQVAPKMLKELSHKVVSFSCKDATCSSKADEELIDKAV